MSRRITLIKKVCAVFMAVVFIQLSANAITYTAVASGSYSSSATWSGGMVPPQTISLLDQVDIGSGYTVTFDQNIIVSAGLATGLDVDGSLVSANNAALIVQSGNLTGSGTIDVDSLSLGIASGFTFTGTIIADDFSSVALNSTTVADVTVNGQLWLNGALDFLANSSLTMGNNATIVITDGVFTNSGGTLNLTGNYNVVYNGSALTAGLELSGSGLQSFTVDLDNNTDMLTLAADLNVKGTLSLLSGRLVLNGNDLTIGADGDISASGTGTVVSTSSSNIIINANGGTAGSLQFSGSANAVNGFTVNVGAGSQTGIEGTLTIAGELMLTSGTLNFSGTNLRLDGTLSGSGMLYANSASNLNITSTSGLSTDLNFAAGGQVVNNLTINTASGTSVGLASALVVDGDLLVNAGTQFDITGVSLTLNDGFSGTGTFTTNSTTDLILNVSNSGSLNITGVNGSVGTLAFNGQGHTLTLTGDLTVNTNLSLQNGVISLDGNDLVIAGGITAGGSGALASNSQSNLSIITTTALAGGLTFTNNNNVNDFIVNIGTGNTLDLNSDVDVDGELQLLSGVLNIEDNDINLQTGATLMGGSDSSYVNTSAGGSLNMQLTANTAATFAVGTDNNYAPAWVELNNGSASGNVGVSVMPEVMAEGTTGGDVSVSQPVVDATWHVTSSISANLNLDLKVMWSTDMEVNGFDRANAYVSHYVNADWDATADMAATTEANGMFSLRRDGLTSLSPFAVFDESTVVTGIKEAANTLQFLMFPNPASTNMIINCPEANSENLMVDIMNIQGGIVRSYNITSDNYSIPVADLASGSYIARVYNAKVNGVQKFTKM